MRTVRIEGLRLRPTQANANCWRRGDGRQWVSVHGRHRFEVNAPAAVRRNNYWCSLCVDGGPLRKRARPISKRYRIAGRRPWLPKWYLKNALPNVRRSRSTIFSIFFFSFCNRCRALGSDTSYARRYDILSATRHPDYSEDNDTNDIAVVRVKRSIAFNTAVGPVCLPFRWAIEGDSTWGWLFTSNHLQLVFGTVCKDSTTRKRSLSGSRRLAGAPHRLAAVFPPSSVKCFSTLWIWRSVKMPMRTHRSHRHNYARTRPTKTRAHMTQVRLSRSIHEWRWAVYIFQRCQRSLRRWPVAVHRSNPTKSNSLPSWYHQLRPILCGHTKC